MENAWKCTHLLKPVLNLCTACVQAWTLGHSLYTEGTAWPLLVHWSCIHSWALAWGHVYISKRFPSLHGHSNFYSSESLCWIYSQVVCIAKGLWHIIIISIPAQVAVKPYNGAISVPYNTVAVMYNPLMCHLQSHTRNCHSPTSTFVQ